MSLARAVGRNTLYTAAARFSVLFVWFAATPILLTALGAERFGFWSILLALGVSLASLDLGLGVSVSREVAVVSGTGDYVAVGRIVAGAVLLQLLLGVCLVVVAWLLREPVLAAFRVPSAWLPEARTALLLGVAGYGLVATGNVLLASLQGMQRMDLGAWVSLPLAVVLFGALLLAARQPEPLLALTIVQVAHGVLMLAGTGFVLARALRAGPRERRSGPPAIPYAPAFRRILTLGGWIQFSALLALVHGQIDKFYLGTGVALAPVASYEIGSRVAQAALMLPILALGSLLPVFARLESTAGPGGRLPAYRAALGPHYLLSLGLVGGLVGLAPAILEAWLGRPPEGAVLMLRGLAVSYGASLVGGVASTLIRSGGPMRIEGAYAVIVTLTHVVLSWIGLRALGPAGVILGNVVGSVLGVAWLVASTERWLGARPLAETLRAAAPAVAAALAAAAVGAAIVALFGGLEPGRARGLAALAAASVAYAAVFVGVLAIAFPASWGDLRARVAAIVRP